MSDNDGDSITKLVILTLGLATIGFFCYLIYKESKGYRLGGQPQQMSLVDDNYFQLERKIHQLEMVKQSAGSTQTMVPYASPVPRKIVPMTKQPVYPNINGLSRGDQDRVRRMFFNML